MSDIGPIGPPSSGAFGNNGRMPAGYTSSPPPAMARGGDAVELSPTARLLSQLREMPDVREGLVARIKEEIANETYETPEKLDSAIEALLDELA